MLRHSIATPFSASFLAAALLWVPFHASGLDITSCGQEVPKGTVAVLQDDLSCVDPENPKGVILGDRATLYLNGHSIASDHAVTCTGRYCGVSGPGELMGTESPIQGQGICLLDKRGTLIVNDLEIHGFEKGIGGPVDSNARVYASDLKVYGNTVGINVTRLKAEEVTVTDNEIAGIDVAILRGRNITAKNNGQGGIVADRYISVKGAVATNNQGAGIVTRRATLRNVLATDNGGAGVEAERLAVRDATLSRNNGAGQGVDILTSRRPNRKNTTCGASRKQKSGVVTEASWGLCAND